MKQTCQNCNLLSQCDREMLTAAREGGIVIWVAFNIIKLFYGMPLHKADKCCDGWEEI
jgi:hypothetical protein